MGGTFAPWYFRSLELSFPGTVAPESENDVELSLPKGKMAWIAPLCQKTTTKCTPDEQGSQDVNTCTRSVEACRHTYYLHSRCFGFTADYCDLLVTSGLRIGPN